MKQHYLLIFLAFLLLAPLANAQILHYDVFYGDSHVGTMKVEKKQEGDKEVLHSYGKVTLDLIWTLKLEFIHHAEFKAGNLLSSMSKNLRGDELTDMSSGYQKETIYQNRVNDELKHAKMPIQHTVLTLYFGEPKGLKFIYSERTGTHLPVRCTKPNWYEIIQTNGHATRYFYENGIVNLMEVDHSLATLQFRLRK